MLFNVGDFLMMSFQLRYFFIYLVLIVLLLIVKKLSDYNLKRLIILFLFPLVFGIVNNLYNYF